MAILLNLVKNVSTTADEELPQRQITHIAIIGKGDALEEVQAFAYQPDNHMNHNELVSKTDTKSLATQIKGRQ